MDYSGIAPYIWFQCPPPMESIAYLPALYFVIPILVATQQIHCSTYAASHIVGHNAPRLTQENEVLLPLKDPFLYKRHLGEIIQSFVIFLINSHI